MRKLSEPETALLMQLADADFRGFGARPSKSPERDALKRLGLIQSSPPNPVGARGVGGKGHRWRLTPAGRTALDRDNQETGR